MLNLPRSLPSRGAWIEIPRKADRNAKFLCRSPRGGRGLKCIVGSVFNDGVVAPLAGGVD